MITEIIMGLLEEKQELKRRIRDLEHMVDDANEKARRDRAAALSFAGSWIEDLDRSGYDDAAFRKKVTQKEYLSMLRCGQTW